MSDSFSLLLLAAILALSLFLSVLNFLFWRIQPDEHTPLWLSAWLGAGALLALCRMLQYASLSEPVYRVLPRVLMTAAYLLAWLGYELANQLTGYRPRRAERRLIVFLAGSLLLLLWGSNLILTGQLLVRSIPLSGKFHGVQTGALYLPSSFLILALGLIALIRLLRSSRPGQPENRLMAAGYAFLVLFSLIDFFSISSNLPWVRLSDYSYLPMAILFTYIQVRQIRRLYQAMGSRVQEQTAELIRVHEALRVSEEQAQLSQQRLLGLVDSAMDAVISVNSEQKIVLFNPAAERMFGYPAAEVLGQPLDRILPDRYRTSHTRQIAEFGRTGITARSMYGYREVTGVRQDGSEFSLEVSISQAEVGGEKQFTAILRDTSERQRAEEALRESEEKYRTLVEKANDGIAIIQHGVVRYINTRLAEMRGESVAAIIGQPFEVFVHPLEKSKILARYQRRMAGEEEPTVYETTLLGRDDIPIPVELTAGLITYQGEPAEILIVRDISERKVAEQALQRQVLEMSVLNQVATVGSAATDIDQLIEHVTGAVGKMFYPDNFGVLVADTLSQTWRPHSSYQGIAEEHHCKIHPYSEGIAGRVFASGRPMRVNDTRQEPPYMEATSGIQSEIAVPIVVNGGIFGCLNAESRRRQAFTEYDERLMCTVADSLATALEKIQLLQAEQRRRKEAEILYNTTHDLIVERDLSRLLQVIVERAAAMLAASSGGLYVCDPEHRVVRCVVSYNTPRSYVGIALRYGEGAAGIVAETGEPLVIEDYRCWASRAAAYELDQPFVSVLSVPMLWQDRVIGVIHILENSKPRSFTDEDLQIVRHFANQAAIAVENARLFEEEQQRRRQEEILRESFLSLTYSMEPEKLFEIILDTLQKLLPYDSASIELSDGIYLTIAAGRNIPHSLIGTRYLDRPARWGDVEKLRRPLIIPDVQNDERFVKFEGTEYIRAWMGIPLFARDKLIGYLNLDSRTVGFYTQAHISMAQIFGSQAAIALENLLLFQETIQHAQQASAIAEIGRDISGTLQLDAVLEKICVYARNLLRAGTSAVYLSRPGQAVLHAIVAMGPDAEQIKHHPLRLGEGILGNIAMQRVGETVNDSSRDPRAITIEGTENAPIEHIMGVPVLSEDQLIGLIAVWRIGEGKDFKPAELAFLSNLAQQVAVAIENARLFQTTRQRLAEIEAVHTVSTALRSAQNLGEALPIILDQLMQLLNASGASLEMLDPASGEIVTEAAYGAWAQVAGLRTPQGSGVSGHVISTGEPYVSTNVIADARAYRLDLFGGLDSVACVPVIAQNQPTGVLWIGRQTPFHPEEVSLFSAIGEMVGNAIHRMQLNEQTIRRADEFEALFRTAQALSAQWELPSLLATVVTQAMQLLQSPGGGIYLYDEKSDDLEIVVAKGPAMLVGLRLKRGEGMAGRVLETRQHLIVDNYRDWEGHAANYKNLLLVGAVIEVPIILAGELIGVLVAYESEESKRKYTESEARLLLLFATQAAGAIRTARLLEELQTSNLELEKAYDTTLEGWARALELRDKETHGHSRRVTDLTLRLARQMNVSPDRLIHIRRGVLLHDIGKMGIPDHMLRKTGPLSEEEWTEMRKHPQYAYDLLHPIAFLRPALDIPYCHHEKWDGSGYPRGLKGEQIPLAARIFAVVDVYDALSFDRSYRKAWSPERVMRYLREQSGRHFDPKVVAAFLKLIRRRERAAPEPHAL